MPVVSRVGMWVVSGRVVGWCVRGRPGLLRHSARVGSGSATWCSLGCSGRWCCGRSFFLGRPRVGGSAAVSPGAGRGSSV